MSRRNDKWFRVFGSPYAAVTHQHVSYLHLKRLPIKSYCGTFLSTKLYSVFYGARAGFCAMNPERDSFLLPWHLMSQVEAQHQEAMNRSKQADKEGQSPSSTAISSSSSGHVEDARYIHARRILLDRRRHPQLHMLSWTFMVYGNWWLTLTGMMYRWLHGDASSIVAGYIHYFLLSSSIGALRPLRDRFRHIMCGLLSLHGVTEASRPYMVEHFEQLCVALDAHCVAMERQMTTSVDAHGRRRQRSATRGGGNATTEEQQQQAPPLPFYVLGTPHPTLADVALGSSFSAYFLLDEAVAEKIATKHEALNRYLERVAGYAQLRQGEFHPSPPLDEVEMAESATDYPDEVPESLKPVLLLMEEVFPFMVDQCDAFRTYISGDGGATKLKRCVLDHKAEGGLEGLSAYVLPQRTPITTVMLVDRHLISVFCRAQDLEIATVAAREVLDLDLAPFNKMMSTTGPIFRNDNEQASTVVDGHGMTGVLTEHNTTTSSPTGIDVQSSVPPLPVLLQRGGAFAHQLPALQYARDHDGKPEEEQLPHVYSRKGGKTLQRFGTYESSLQLKRRLRSMDDVMLSLYKQLLGMHTPQFTLSAVTQGGRIFVAAIPEHEYDKKRKRDDNNVKSS